MARFQAGEPTGVAVAQLEILVRRAVFTRLRGFDLQFENLHEASL